MQLEITEGALMADPRRVLATLQRLDKLGVALSLDDFGTGYSSMQHLRRLPLAEVKIDRSFVLGMADDPDDDAIVRSIIDLAGALDLRVVAEGVEDDRTRRLLVAAGCDVAQGWYLRPADAGRRTRVVARALPAAGAARVAGDRSCPRRRRRLAASDRRRVGRGRDGQPREIRERQQIDSTSVSAHQRHSVPRGARASARSGMSAISRAEVAHLARLSRLAVTDEELDVFAGQLDVILSVDRPHQ